MLLAVHINNFFWLIVAAFIHFPLLFYYRVEKIHGVTIVTLKAFFTVCNWNGITGQVVKIANEPLPMSYKRFYFSRLLADLRILSRRMLRIL